MTKIGLALIIKSLSIIRIFMKIVVKTSLQRSLNYNNNVQYKKP